MGVSPVQEYKPLAKHAKSDVGAVVGAAEGEYETGAAVDVMGVGDPGDDVGADGASEGEDTTMMSTVAVAALQDALDVAIASAT